VAIFSFASAAVGAMAIALVMTEPGVGFLVVVGWILTIPITLEIWRASARELAEPPLLELKSWPVARLSKG
jgi:hypothetical protein